MFDVTLVTSMYRTGAHLPLFVERAAALGHAAREHGVSIEFIPVANDATAEERVHLAAFQAAYPDVYPIFTARETLYSSWNRGVRAARSAVVGFWNVDDARTLEGVLEGVAHVRRGCKVVYFAHNVLRSNLPKAPVKHYPAIPYSREAHQRLMKCGPFFMFDRGFYETVGAFDEHFRIAGDADWCSRATSFADLCPVDVLAGTFYLHGANLSDTGDPLQEAEQNIVYLKNNTPQYLQPADPDVMRRTWSQWGDALPLDAATQALLWGDGARDRYVQTVRDRRHKQRRQQIEQAIRYLPRTFIDRLGLRESLARIGIVKSEKKKP